MMTSVIREDVARILADLAPAVKQLEGGTVLVTGAGGFLGAYFVDVLAALGAADGSGACRILALDNWQTGHRARVDHLRSNPHVEFVDHDVRRPYEPSCQVEWVIHLASIASPTAYRRAPLDTIDVNVNGTRHVLDLAVRHRCRSVLHLSSSEIYGDPPRECVPTPETYWGSVSCTGPRACYDESKRVGETLCTTYHRLYGLPVKIVRPFNVYGPGQRLDDGRVLPDFVRDSLHGRPITVYSDGRATRSFCYIRDFITGAMSVWLSSADGEAFNVGNDEEVTVAELAERVAIAAGPPRVPVQPRTHSDRDYVTDNPQRRCPDLRKVRQWTDWRPAVMLDEGLARTLASYREILAAGLPTQEQGS